MSTNSKRYQTLCIAPMYICTEGNIGKFTGGRHSWEEMLRR